MIHIEKALKMKLCFYLLIFLTLFTFNITKATEPTVPFEVKIYGISQDPLKNEITLRAVAKPTAKI
jgi:hypothetical protein